MKLGLSDPVHDDQSDKGTIRIHRVVSESVSASRHWRPTAGRAITVLQEPNWDIEVLCARCHWCHAVTLETSCWRGLEELLIVSKKIENPVQHVFWVGFPRICMKTLTTKRCGGFCWTRFASLPAVVELGLRSAWFKMSLSIFSSQQWSERVEPCMIRPAGEPDCTALFFCTYWHWCLPSFFLKFSRTGHFALSTFNVILLKKELTKVPGADVETKSHSHRQLHGIWQVWGVYPGIIVR